MRLGAFSATIMLMPPQQTIYTPGETPPSNTGQYDFIVNGSSHASSGLFSANASLKTRILVVAIGSGLLLIAALLFAAIISRAGGINSSDLVGVAQRQMELARISQAPVTGADTQATQDFAATMMLSLISEQQVILHFLAQNGTSVNGQVLQARQSSLTDKTLKNAQTSGTYDQTYISIAREQLQSYVQALKTAYHNAPTKAEQQLLQDTYDQAQLLITQSSQTE